MVRLLNAGDVFPEYQVRTTGGGIQSIPRDFSGEFAVLLFYRGGW